jgi:hypothetical protein
MIPVLLARAAARARTLLFVFLFPTIMSAQVPEKWFTQPMLLEGTRYSQMYAFVNKNIPPLPQFRLLAERQAYRQRTRTEILRLLEVDDILAEYKLKLHSATATRNLSARPVA